MKSIILISVFFIAATSTYSQIDRIDNLIGKLDNNQLVGVCNYVWVLKNVCKEADTLVDLSKQIDSEGKPIFKKAIVAKLISLLTDSIKGIIAHYVLSNISTSVIRQGSTFMQDSLLTIHYTY